MKFWEQNKFRGKKGNFEKKMKFWKKKNLKEKNFEEKKSNFEKKKEIWKKNEILKVVP